MTPLLEVRDLRIDYTSARTTINAVRGINFHVDAGETVAVVGESGSGKSTTAAALVRLLPRAASITGGSITFAGTDVLKSGARAARAVLGRRIGYVPQDPSVSLNPVMRIGDQVAEVLQIHKLADRRTAQISAIEALTAAGIDRPEERARQYPHELSGGQRQRVLIAIAVAARPALIVADEPTSALDVTVQRRILDHLGTLTRELGASVLLVTHDLGVAADRADRILVLSRGELVEHGTPAEILDAPQHSYTRSLISAAPSLRTNGGAFLTRARTEGTETARLGAPLLEARELVKDFGAGRRGTPSQPAVDEVSLTIHRGRTLSLVGESGSGKTTTARLVLRLVEPTSGSIMFDGADITALRGEPLRQLRRRIQVVYQNPFASLDPRLSIGQLVVEPMHSLAIGTRGERRARAAELLDLVGLPASYARRRPAELSGGQRQRVAIARALSVSPELVVLDEPVSALDVRVQAQILSLLVSLQAELGVAYLFISHDLAVVRQVSHEVGVMSRGRLVELGPSEQIFDSPRHEYTRELLDAIPGGARTNSPHPLTAR